MSDVNAEQSVRIRTGNSGDGADSIVSMASRLDWTVGPFS